METKFRFTPHTILGGILILLGIYLLLSNLGFFYGWSMFRLWPAIFIIIGLSLFLQAGRLGGKITGGILILFGVLFLLRTLHILYFRFGDIWPLFLILIGGGILFNALYRNKYHLTVSEGSDPDNFITAFAFLSGFARKSNTSDFRGGNLTVFMGGCEIDLRQASMESGEAKIDVLAIWGGIDIKVPADWSVSLKGLPILGGIEDKTRQPEAPTGKRLIVSGTAIMGGVSVSN